MSPVLGTTLGHHKFSSMFSAVAWKDARILGALLNNQPHHGRGLTALLSGKWMHLVGCSQATESWLYCWGNANTPSLLMLPQICEFAFNGSFQLNKKWDGPFGTCSQTLAPTYSNTYISPVVGGRDRRTVVVLPQGSKANHKIPGSVRNSVPK